MHKNLNLFLQSIIIIIFFLLCMPWEIALKSEVNLNNTLALPSILHPLGTDNLGRDLLVRISIAIKHIIIPMWIMILIFSILNIIIFYLHIKIMSVKLIKALSYFLYLFILTLISIPSIVIILGLGILFEGFFTKNILLVISFLLSLKLYVELFNLYNKDKNLLYWTTNQSHGGSVFYRITYYGILGSWKTHIINIIYLNLKASILIESGLSYLGLGVQEPNSSLGNILASHFDLYFKNNYFILILTSTILMICSLVPQSLYILFHQIYQTYLNRLSCNKI